MSPARRTTAYRRIKRYRAKRTWKVIPERLKRLIVEPPYHMPREWEDQEPPFVYCETPTMLLLEALEVNAILWPYYIGFMKRLLALYKNFTGETLLLEIQSLIAEYVLRGYDEEVLDEVHLVVQDCSEACYLSCEIVKACLEGDYSSWAVYDRFADADFTGNNLSDSGISNSDETKLVIINGLDANIGILKTYDIATKILGAVLMNQIFTTGAVPINALRSVLGKYVVMLKWTDAVNNLDELRIFKDGVLQQTLTDVQLGIQNNTIKTVFISHSGKYIGVGGFLPAPINAWGWVILEGS
ncbi:hypothetical protein ES703_02132 [subsurface metagenome]